MSPPIHNLVKRAATLEETRLLVSTASHKDINDLPFHNVARDTHRWNAVTAELDFNNLKASLEITPVCTFTDEELAEKLNVTRDEVAALEEEQEIRAKAAKVISEAVKERLKIVARINDNSTTRRRPEEEFKQLCRKHATLLMEAAKAGEILRGLCKRGRGSARRRRRTRT